MLEKEQKRAMQGGCVLTLIVGFGEGLLGVRVYTVPLPYGMC
jgi:hypothetical protein